MMIIPTANVAAIDAVAAAVVAIVYAATPVAAAAAVVGAAAATAELGSCQPWSVFGGNCHFIS